MHVRKKIHFIDNKLDHYCTRKQKVAQWKCVLRTYEHVIVQVCARISKKWTPEHISNTYQTHLLWRTIEICYEFSQSNSIKCQCFFLSSFHSFFMQSGTKNELWNYCLKIICLAEILAFHWIFFESIIEIQSR